MKWLKVCGALAVWAVLFGLFFTYCTDRRPGTCAERHVDCGGDDDDTGRRDP
jgi:hypothetical protein